MSAPLSQDLRRRVVQARLDGLTIEATAERFSIGTASVQRWTRQFRETGSVAPKPHNGGPKPKIRDEGADVLRALVLEQPTLTIAEYAAEWTTRTGISTSVSAMHRALTELGLRLKKGARSRPSGTAHG